MLVYNDWAGDWHNIAVFLRLKSGTDYRNARFKKNWLPPKKICDDANKHLMTAMVERVRHDNHCKTRLLSIPVYCRLWISTNVIRAKRIFI